MKRLIVVLLVLTTASISQGKVDLVTLPSRDTVQLTIYNSADLTLARENRALTVKKGVNKLQFSWENTLIDPTSLEMLPKANADKIAIANLVFPPRVKNLGLWNIDSELSGKVPVEISFLTSGISWRAFYMGTLTPDEKAMKLQGYVVVTNNSGEDYADAQVRLIVGKVHMIDQIAELARRQYPYGSPIATTRGMAPGRDAVRHFAKAEETVELAALDLAESAGLGVKKQIVKEGLSEYFLYTIEGTETIANGWSKRLISLEADEVDVVNLYKYEQERYGNAVVRFLSFKNDEDHDLGETPIPGGRLKVYRGTGDGHLSYTGQSAFKYVPVGEDVELNLGTVADVVVEPKLMDFRTDQYMYTVRGDVCGWDEIRRFEVEVKNTRDIPVKVEIQRNFANQYWDLRRQGEFDEYEKVDLDTVKFTLTLQRRSVRKFEYTVRTYQGDRQRAWRE